MHVADQQGRLADRSARLWLRMSNNECKKPDPTMQESMGLFRKNSMQPKLSVIFLKEKAKMFIINGETGERLP